MYRPVVFFDLDGTLTDPAEGIINCIHHALRRLGREDLCGQDLRWCIGPPLRQSFERLLNTECAAEAWRAVELYRERFGDVGLFENSVYPGVPEMLETLREAGTRLYVATSKPHVYARRILAHFQLDHAFHGIFGSELDGTRTDKVELIRYALSETGFAPEVVAMVGDREHDVRGARVNGLLGVGVTYGFGSERELREAGASVICQDPETVCRTLLRLG